MSVSGNEVSNGVINLGRNTGERQAGEMVRKTTGHSLYIFETSVEYLGVHIFSGD